GSPPCPIFAGPVDSPNRLPSRPWRTGRPARRSTPCSPPPPALLSPRALLTTSSLSSSSRRTPCRRRCGGVFSASPMIDARRASEVRSRRPLVSPSSEPPARPIHVVDSHPSALVPQGGGRFHRTAADGIAAGCDPGRRNQDSTVAHGVH